MFFENPRKYGSPPYNIVLVHGGPGAAGEMAPVAVVLAQSYGVCEPMQTAFNIKGQVEELKNLIKLHTSVPIILIGFSWGAWLTFIFTATYPYLVKKLILISSGPFENKYAKSIIKTRFSRFDNDEQVKLDELFWRLGNRNRKNKNKIFEQIGELVSKADAYKKINTPKELIHYQYNIYEAVWKEADELRKKGKLLKLGKQIHCPVVAIHGDYDPHPSDGVQKPLSKTLKNFTFALLKNCGHKPWYEAEARENFFRILNKEIKNEKRKGK